MPPTPHPRQVGSHIISVIITQLPRGLGALRSPLHSSRGIFLHISSLSPCWGSHVLQRARSASSAWHSRTFMLGLCGSLPTHLLHPGFQQRSTSCSSPNNPYDLVMRTSARRVLSTRNVFTFPIQPANSYSTFETQLTNLGWHIFFCKGPDGNISGLVGHMVSVTIPQFCHCRQHRGMNE